MVAYGFDKKGVSGLAVMVIVFVLILILFVFVVPKSFWENLGILDMVGGGTENRELIRTECILACGGDNGDGDEEYYCNPHTLKLGDGYKVKASCLALSKMAIRSFDGVPKCRNFNLECDPDKSKEAVCYYNSKKIDCKELLP